MILQYKNLKPGDKMDIHTDNIVHTEELSDYNLRVWYYEVDNR